MPGCSGTHFSSRACKGETSKILTIYTQNHGKINLIAKGSRSIKSRHWGTLEPFTHIALVYYYKDNRDLQFISQADIIAAHPSIQSQLGKMILASILCELILRIETAENENPALFRLLLEALSTLNTHETGLRNIIRSFQLKLVSLSGYEPNLSRCAVCGRTELESYVNFNIDAGQYTCQHCSIKQKDQYSVSANAIKIMRWLQQVSIQQSVSAKISVKTGREVDTFLLFYLRYHVEGLSKLNTVEFLDKIESDLSKKNSDS